MVELRGLLQLCQNVVLEDGNDKVGWDLDDLGLTHPDFRLKWNNWVPGKVGILVWRVDLDRIPVIPLLAKRNVLVGFLDCPACGEADETTEHVFVSCGLAQAVWQAVSTWCKVPHIFAFSIRDILELYKFIKGSKRKAKFFHAVCMVSVWCLWKARNDIVFNGMAITVEIVVGNIKALGYLWVKNRSGGSSLSWEDWCKFKV
ncbi:uncharacterized protein LOC143576894 [Bidens hawaiensis]|uniref:uncharacterized protein LOC143576894 n=1 Tax=Bidens hawaiensis TaxID=980011 RepID=UPI004049B4A8